EDGVVNGVVKTRSIVYSVMPQEYRKGGGCSMGSSKDLSLLSLLLLPLLILLRRSKLMASFLLVLSLSLSSYANMEQVKEHIKRGEYEEAMPLLEELIKKDGLSEERSLLRSYLMLKVGDVKGAIKQTEEDLAFLPSRRLRLRLAYLYALDGNIKKAKEILNAQKEKDQEYYFTKGHIEYLEGNYTSAKYSLLKVSPSSPNYSEAQFYLAQIYAIEKDSNRFYLSLSKIERGSEYSIYGESLRESYQQRKKFGLNLSLGLEYDTNLLGVFDLETKIKTSKTFASLSASYEGDNLRGRVRAYHSFNRKGSSYNIGFYSLELESLLGNFSFPLKVDYITLGGDFYANINQVGIAYRSNYGSLYTIIGYQNYLSQAFDFENRDGYFLQIGHRYEYIRDKVYINQETYARSTDAKGQNWDSLSVGVKLFGNYALNDRLSLGMNTAFEGYSYTRENQAFLKKRRDAFLSLSPFLNLNLYRNFSLLLSYTYMRNLSSINYYSYKKNLYTLQLIGKF
ncbi:MAG: hypothetical protein ACK4VK_07175, partial [Aquificaceae bacterium]